MMIWVTHDSEDGWSDADVAEGRAPQHLFPYGTRCPVYGGRGHCRGYVEPAAVTQDDAEETS